MANSKPKGKELKIAKEISKLIYKFRKIVGLCHVPTDALIHIDFTLEGVRTNGHASVTSLYDVKMNLEDYKKSCKDEIKERQKVIKHTDLILAKLTWFKTCSKCKGEKGYWEDQAKKYHRGYWKDCSKCKGRGILEIQRKKNNGN